MSEQRKLALAAFAWPLARVGDAIGLLAHRRGLIPAPANIPAPPALASASPLERSRWVEAAADWLGVEAESLPFPYARVERLLHNLGPGLLFFPDGEHFLALLHRRGNQVILLAPDGTERALGAAEIASALRHPLEAPLLAEIDGMLLGAGVPEGRQQRAREALLQERLGSKSVAEAWLLRLSPGADIWQQARQAGLPRLLLAFAVVYLPKMFFWLGGWWVLWRAALQGEPEWGWLLLWVIVLFTNLPFRLLEPWFGDLFSITVGWLFKKRLLYGAMQLRPEEIRHQGVGQLLGRTIESEAAESLALGGGVLILSHGIDLLLAIPILLLGVGGVGHLLLLVAWLLLSAWLTWRYLRLRRRWTQQRLDLTHDLVEQMVGYQTRLAQQSPARWHEGEDEALEQYLQRSQQSDQAAALVKVIVPRGWLFLGFLALLPAVLRGDPSTVSLATGVGAVLFVYQSLELMAEGLLSIADALIAWEQVAPLFHAAGRSRIKGLPGVALAGQAPMPAAPAQPLVDARNLGYRYRAEGEAVLDHCTLRLYPGERLLLEGPSGGGKSTLASLIVGLREPTSGLLLLHGLDKSTLGSEGWRQRVAAAPQFHENHVFSNTLAFNLLMGRGWPPQEADWREAQAICQELGLGELLARMPSGMLQMVGETGWQLSHGERSRLYIARALLQHTDLIVLDESFAALDPDNLQQALHCVFDRAPTLLVIAHP